MKLIQMYEANSTSVGVNEISMAKTREEIIWRQRSKIQWMQEGDKNSWYFHSKTSQERKNNLIIKLQNDHHNGEWQESEQKDKLIGDYFQNLFIAAFERFFLKVLNGVQRKITNEMNELAKEYIEEEVIQALKQNASNKSSWT